jgi:hypothetical protein
MDGQVFPETPDDFDELDDVVEFDDFDELDGFDDAKDGFGLVVELTRQP